MKIPYHINTSKLVTLIKDQLNNFNGEAEIVLNDAEKDGWHWCQAERQGCWYAS